MAVLPAAPGSKLVLATAGGSPGWLLGPLRFAGAPGAAGTLAGPLFYAALWLALGLYVVVLATARSLPLRVALGAVAGLHLLFLLAPPLLSQDVFSYIAYARLGAVHHLNPYVYFPFEIAGDSVYGFAGSKAAVSAYGPVFTLLTYPLASLGLPAALWILKVVAAAASLGLVWVVWRAARLLGRDPLVPALAVGLHPLVLCHVVAGAHNEALVVLLTMAGVALWLGGREVGGGIVAALAVGVKASAALVLPFLTLSRPRAGRLIAAVAAAIAALVALGVAVFGTHSLDAFALITSNQGRTSRYSVPRKLAELAAGAVGGSRHDFRTAFRIVFALAFAAVFLWLLWRTWRRLIAPLEAIGWTTLAILVASAWLLPWYILWLLPFAALSRDRRLHIGTLAMSAWMLRISVPL